MSTPELLVQNRTATDLHMIVRPLNGTLRILFFPAAVRGSITVPPDGTVRCAVGPGVASCIRDSKLAFELRNQSGRAIAMSLGNEEETNYPAIVIHDRDAGDVR